MIFGSLLTAHNSVNVPSFESLRADSVSCKGPWLLHISSFKPHKTPGSVLSRILEGKTLGFRGAGVQAKQLMKELEDDASALLSNCKAYALASCTPPIFHQNLN